MSDTKPRTCQEWQVVLKGIAERREPDSTEVATMARVHALRCCDCWSVFGIASADALERGIKPVPPMLRRVVAAIERPARTEPVDLNMN